MYTICRGNKTVSVKTDNKDYIIGFKNAYIARKVQYNMHPEPKIILLKSNTMSIEKENINIYIDNDASLFIQKLQGDYYNPINDGGYHMKNENLDNFMLFPFTNSIGIIIPYNLIDETNDEYIFKCIVLDPSPMVELFKAPSE